MLTQTLKFLFLIASIVIALFVGAISIVGGHGQFNYLSLISILILLSAILIAIFYNKEGKTKSFISLAFLLVAAISYLILIVDFFQKNVAEKHTEFHVMKWTMLVNFLLLLYLSIKKVQSHFKTTR